MRGTERGRKEFEMAEKTAKSFYVFFMSRRPICRIVLCIVNGQIAATLSHKRTIRGKRRIRHILNYLALQQYDSPHSKNPVSRFANVRTVRMVIPVFVSFLFCVCHEPSPVIAPSLHTHERLRQHQGITWYDTSRN